MRKPFYRADRGLWYVWHQGRQVNLGSDEKAAYETWQLMLKARAPDDPLAPLATIVDSYLEHSAKHHSSTTHEWYRRYLLDFTDYGGNSLVSQLKPYHVTRWIARHPEWGPSSQRAAITAVKSALNWALAEELIPRNPIAKVKRPATPRREVLIEPETHDAIRNETDAAFSLVVTALRHSGCRPGELAIITAKHLSPDGQFWILQPHEHKTGRRTGRAKVVPLSPCLSTISRLLATQRPAGPLFLNSRGKAWTRNAIRLRMQRLREKLKLPAGTVAYSYRHTFTTDALTAGVDSATVAEILGHTSTRMVSERYGHLDQKRQHLLAAVQRATKPAG